MHRSHGGEHPGGASGTRSPSRIAKLVSETPHGGVVAICAAPGYGATSALAGAVRGGGSRVLWASLPPAPGADAAWSRVRAAVAGVDARDPRQSAASPVTGTDQVEWVLTRLARTGPTWLVLDGLDVTHHRELLSQLPLLCNELPTTTRLGITSHQRVDLAVPRMLRLDETELTLLPDEAADLLAGIAPGMDVDVAGALVWLAEGWPAALRAGAERALRHGDRLASRWLRGPGLDTLFGGWFAGLPQPAQQFLTDTAVLELLEARSCDAVRAATGSARMLSELAAAHSYIREELDPDSQAVPRHDSADPQVGAPTPGVRAAELGQRVWRRHGLLTGFLRGRSVPGPDSPDRHLRAAEHFRSRQFIDAALSHYVAAGHTREAGLYLAEMESELIISGRAGRALDWYQALPADTWGDRMVHLLRIGWAQAIVGDVRGADLVLAQLAARGAQDDPRLLDDRQLSPAAESAPQLMTGQRLSAEIDVLTAAVAAYHADPATMISAAQRAITGFGANHSSEGAQLAPILLLRGLLWAGQVEPALTHLARIERRDFANDSLRESNLAGMAAKCEVLAGRVHAGLRSANDAIDWLTRRGLTPNDTGAFGPLTARGLALMESADIPAAREHLEHTAAETRNRGQVGDHVYTMTVLVRLHTLRRDWDAAYETLAQARSALQGSCPNSLMFTLLGRADAALRLASGDLDRARELIRDTPASTERSLLWVAVNLRGNESAVRRALEAITPATVRVAASRQVLLAAAQLPGGRRLAEGHLLKAVEIAHKSGQATLLCTAPRSVNDLADSLNASGRHAGLSWLIAARDTVTQTRAAPPERHRPGLLSPGELQLLALLPSRSTNPELALQLGVSPNTIKTRLRRLYQKLDVGSRDAAIARANQMGVPVPEREPLPTRRPVAAGVVSHDEFGG